MKTLLLMPLIVLLAAIPTTALAQTNDWTLTVYLKNVPFGTDKVYVEVKGPFGNNYYEWVTNQVDPSTTFSMSGSEFPQDYNYQVCAGTGLLGSILPSCSSFTHAAYGDAQVTLTFQQ